MTTTINDNLNDKLKDFQTVLIKTCEEMIAQQMSVINLNMINVIKVTLEEQRVNPLTQSLPPSTPINTHPISQLTTSPTSTELITNERQQTAKRKQTDPPDSEEEENAPEVVNNSDMILEEQTPTILNQTRTTTRLSAPAIRDNKKKSQLTSKKTLSRLGKTRK